MSGYAAAVLTTGGLGVAGVGLFALAGREKRPTPSALLGVLSLGVGIAAVVASKTYFDLSSKKEFTHKEYFIKFFNNLYEL